MIKRNFYIYWGAGLLILLIGVGAFVFYSQYSELQQLKQDAAEAEKLLEEKNKPIVVAEAQRQPPPNASPEAHTNDQTISISNSDNISLNTTHIPEEDLINYYIKLHDEKYPDCKNRNAALSDAKRRAKWVLDYKIYSEKANELRIESKAIDDEIRDIVGDNIDDYYKRLNSLSNNEKKSIQKKAEALHKRSLDVGEKYETLYQSKPVYPEGLHTH